MDQPNRCSKVSLRHVTAWGIAIIAITGWLMVVFLIRHTLQNDSHHFPAEHGCSKKARDDCQDNVEGNFCVETGSFPFYQCNCTAHGYAVRDEHFCVAELCIDWDDLFACKAHIKWNTCRMEKGVQRNCSCSAPGYQVRESRRGDICWRTQCTSYQEDQCHIEENGNTCTVLDDVFQCTCNAPGYNVEPVRGQRCFHPASTHSPKHSVAHRHMAVSSVAVTIMATLLAIITEKNW